MRLAVASLALYNTSSMTTLRTRPKYFLNMRTRPVVIWILAGLLVLSGIASAAVTGPRGGDPNRLDLSLYQANPVGPPLPVVDARPRSTIIFIGDGMGFGQVTAARIKAVGRDGRLFMERMPSTGIVVTHSDSNLVPDSAACGTALACGVKTANGVVGQTAEARTMSILEAARQKGMRTGLVATSSITDATPAAFVAHVTSRKMEALIAEQILTARVNVLFGGGRQFFLPKSQPGSKRSDQNDLIRTAEASGYLYIETAEQLRCVRADHVLGLFALGGLTTLAPEPTLAELTKTAIGLLDTDRKGLLAAKPGFFLMVEGSQIDSGCHENDPNKMARQLVLFDQAVQTGLAFALRDRHTLVIVTADHETGGLVIAGDQAKRSLALGLKWTSKNHSGLPVPLYAFGPGSQRLVGVHDNTDIPKIVARLLGIKEFPTGIYIK